MQVNDFRRMIIPFKDKMFRFALRIAGNQFDAEDIIQEVMVKLWRKKEQLMTVDNKEAWCMTVTRNMAIDWKRSKIKRFSELSDHTHITDKEATPAQSLEQSELSKMVRSCIDQLPDQQREIIHLRDIEGYSYKEIAAMTGKTVDQIKVQIYRGRQKLKSIITKNKLWKPKG
jgi:RNA polymerase sigma-70 factor (ECF subfamily)